MTIPTPHKAEQYLEAMINGLKEEGLLHVPLSQFSLVPKSRLDGDDDFFRLTAGDWDIVFILLSQENLFLINE